MSLYELFRNFNEENRSLLSPAEIKKVNATLFALKYLDNKRKEFYLPTSCSMEQIIQSKDDVEDAVIAVLQTIENHLDSLKQVFPPYEPFKKIDRNVLSRFLFDLDNTRIKEAEWAAFSDFLFDFNQNNRTPDAINQLGIALLNITEGKLYDGALGVGGSLVIADRIAKQQEVDLSLYGQEVSRETWSLAKLNLFLNRVENAEVALGDTLVEPKFVSGGQLKTFDFVYMNYPFAMRLNKHGLLEQDSYKRFQYGPVPKSSADSAFIQHAVASLNSQGRGVLVVPNGVLFRAAEQTLRRNLLSKDMIEAVIALPENLFGYTSIQTNLLVLNKNKPPHRKNKVLFVNGSEEFGEERKKRVLQQENIKTIQDIFVKGTEKEKVSKFVPLSEIDHANLLCSNYLKDNQVATDSFGTVTVYHTELERLPNLEKLGEIAVIYRGINLVQRQIIEGEGPYKIINLRDVNRGRVMADDIAYCDINIQKKLASYIVKEGDIVLSSRGENIKIAIVPPHSGTLILSQNFLGIRVGEETNAYYLKALLESPLGKFLIAGIQSGTSIKNINAKDLAALRLPFAPSNTQKELGEIYRGAEATYLEKIKKAKEEHQEALCEVYKEMGISQTMKWNER